jgi:hypothetical protein
VFVDSDAATWQIDPADVRRKIAPRTKAVIAVHLYGHPCELDELQAICRQNNRFLVEDCAEAIGTVYENRRVGSFRDISSFSVFGNKTLTTGGRERLRDGHRAGRPGRRPRAAARPPARGGYRDAAGIQQGAGAAVVRRRLCSQAPPCRAGGFDGSQQAR